MVDSAEDAVRLSAKRRRRSWLAGVMLILALLIGIGAVMLIDVPPPDLAELEGGRLGPDMPSSSVFEWRGPLPEIPVGRSRAWRYVADIEGEGAQLRHAVMRFAPDVLDEIDRAIEQENGLPQVIVASLPNRLSVASCDRRVGEALDLIWRIAAADGDANGATRALRALVLFGDRRRREAPSLPHFQHGLTVTTATLDNYLDQLADATNVEVIDSTRKFLRTTRKRRSMVRPYLRVIYDDYSDAIDQHASANDDWFTTAFDFKPNRCRAAFLRVLVQADEQWGSVYHPFRVPEVTLAGKAHAWLTGNRKGRDVVGEAVQTTEQQWVWLWDERAKLILAEASLAVRIYELREGKLPATWADLMPEYFSEPPRDPFGHEPLTLDLEYREILAPTFEAHREDRGWHPGEVFRGRF